MKLTYYALCLLMGMLCYDLSWARLIAICGVASLMSCLAADLQKRGQWE